jgi:methoxymalonate biosynthesis acyl carrier protein
MEPTEVEEKISLFLLKHINVDTLKPDEDIFDAGYVTSMFALQLIAFVERTFPIEVQDEDLEITNFNSLRAIGSFVGRKVSKSERTSA